MTISDITHYSVNDRKLLIYKTPDSAEYDIIIVGSRNQETLTASDSLNTDPNISWAIMFKALQHIAEINGAEKESDRYHMKSLERKTAAIEKRSRINYNNLKASVPYDLT